MAAGDSRDEEAVATIQRVDQLKSDRSNFEATWNDCRKVFTPGSKDFTATNDTQGQRDRRVAVDGHGMLANRDLAEYLAASVCSPATKWISYAPTDPRRETTADDRLWLDYARDVTLRAFHDPASLFADGLMGCLLEHGAFGNGALYIGDRPGKLPLFLQAPLAASVWDLDGDGELSFFAWCKRYTARQAKLKFRELTPPAVLTMADSQSGAETKLDFLHICELNPDAGGEGVKGRPWRTRWICKDHGALISTAYIMRQCYVPFSAPRNGEDIYGRGCGDYALEDTNMSQRVRVTTVRGMEKAVDPTTLVADDGVISAPTSEARGVVVVRAETMRQGNPPVAQLTPTGRPELGLEVSRELHASIDRHFYTQYTRLPREPRMPTQQIIGLQEEQMRALGPMLARLQRPLGLVVMRVYDILAMSGRIADAPETMNNRSITPVFESPSIRQMQMAEVRAFMQWLEVVGASAKADPGVVHVCKWTDAVRDTARALGVPQRYIASDTEVAAGMAQQSKIAEAGAQMEGVEKASQAAKNVTPLLKLVSDNGGAAAAGALAGGAAE